MSPVPRRSVTRTSSSPQSDRDVWFALDRRPSTRGSSVCHSALLGPSTTSPPVCFQWFASDSTHWPSGSAFSPKRPGE